MRDRRALTAFAVFVLLLGIPQFASADLGAIRGRVRHAWRGRLVHTTERKLEQFVRGLESPVREAIVKYPASAPEARAELMALLLRRLAVVLDGFNLARCQRGMPQYDGSFPLPAPCVQDDVVLSEMPYRYRAIRLLADDTNLFLEAEARNARGDRFFARIFLGSNLDDELEQIREAVEEYYANGMLD